MTVAWLSPFLRGSGAGQAQPGIPPARPPRCRVKERPPFARVQGEGLAFLRKQEVQGLINGCLVRAARPANHGAATILAITGGPGARGPARPSFPAWETPLCLADPSWAPQARGSEGPSQEEECSVLSRKPGGWGAPGGPEEAQPPGQGAGGGAHGDFKGPTVFPGLPIFQESNNSGYFFLL